METRTFARLFESEALGQIVVLLKANDDSGAPELRLFFDLGQFFADADISSIAFEAPMEDPQAWMRMTEKREALSAEKAEYWIREALGKRVRKEAALIED